MQSSYISNLENQLSSQLTTMSSHDQQNEMVNDDEMKNEDHNDNDKSTTTTISSSHNLPSPPPCHDCEMKNEIIVSSKNEISILMAILSGLSCDEMVDGRL